ncbi:hypothetical protein, partial [Hyphomonas atlantica]|uniref:hypothetical protein n=1 Tax=Hyphomonas atlantica TaxID=1280948 RepID=UPI0023F14870
MSFRFQHKHPDWRTPSGYPMFPAPDGTDSAAGAVALRLMVCSGYGMERYRPPRRTGSSADTSKGPKVPGLRYRRRANTASVLFTRKA